MNLSDQIVDFYRHLDVPDRLPPGVEIMNPYQHMEVMNYISTFYSKYYNNINPRVLLVGINPGRFGGGLTGIPFTDPINLEEICGIPNNLDKRHELSSKFIYKMIEALGGTGKFYGSFYITAASPIGFVKDGKNLNYYDIPDLMDIWTPFILKTLKHQVKICNNNSVCFSLGQGKNFKFLQALNERYGIFKKVKALPHPRWIMQYRLRKLDHFIHLYKQELEEYLI